MKKFLSILCIITLLCSCSCYFNNYSEIYIPQKNINLNYNNINSCPNFWLTNESISFLEHNFFQNYYIVTKTGKKKITSNSGYVSGTIQQYGNTMYMMEEYDNNLNTSYYLFKSYDIKTGKITKIAEFKNCIEYLVLGDNVYILKEKIEEDKSIIHLSEYSLSFDKLTEIKHPVLSFGVIDNSLVYMTKEENSIFIYKYENNKSVKIGEFSVSKEYINLIHSGYIIVSYTSDCVLLTVSGYTEDSVVFKYMFNSNEVIRTDFNGYIENFVAYDKFSYLTLIDEKININKLYKMSNDTNELTQIGEFTGVSSIFVGSDDGAYVLEIDTGQLFYYSEQENKRFVYGS